MRVFGCKSFYHIPKDERTKLDPKGKISIFLGYCDDRRGYRVYDEDKNKVVFSRDVIFQENCVGINLGSDCKTESLAGFCPDDFLDLPSRSDSNDIDCDNSDINRNNSDNVNSSEICVPGPVAADLGVRKSDRTRRPPARFGEWSNVACRVSEPISYDEAINCADSQRWVEAMDREIDNMVNNEVFEFVKLPTGAQIIKCRWLYKVKNNNVYKARLVAQGYSQIYGVDYLETF